MLRIVFAIYPIVRVAIIPDVLGSLLGPTRARVRTKSIASKTEEMGRQKILSYRFGILNTLISANVVYTFHGMESIFRALVVNV